VRFPSINASYDGVLDGDVIDGTLTQGARLALRLYRGDAGLSLAPPFAALSQARLDGLVSESVMPGIAASAAHRDGATLNLAAGVRRAGQDARVTPSDLWHLGSITKSMTATLVARLVEAGHLRWDAPLSETLGSVVPDMRPEYQGITLRHLLSHRSGLRANLIEMMLYPREEADAREGRLRFARSALASAPVGPAETHFEYSNAGYIVVGALLEQALGAPWEVLIARHLFEPLGLETAGFGAPGRAGAIEQPEGHARGLLGLRSYPPGAGGNDNPAVLGPAGRVHMGLGDLLRFAGAHRDRSALLTSDSWGHLHTPPFGGDYAMGLVARDDGSLWHNGSNTLWYAEVLIDPVRGLVAAAAANSGVLDSVQPAVGQALAEAAAAVVA
jgi:CubicO group peptidase (beta-lactamase class C family)